MRPIVNALWVAAAVGLAATAMASAVRFEDRPRALDEGTVMSLEGGLHGLSPEDFIVRVRATGTATFQCVDPAGGEPAGRLRRSPVAVSGETLVPAEGVVDGRAPFQVTTAEPRVTSLWCPNDRGAVELRDVEFRSVTVRVYQARRVVLRRTWAP